MFGMLAVLRKAKKAALHSNQLTKITDYSMEHSTYKIPMLIPIPTPILSAVFILYSFMMIFHDKTTSTRSQNPE